MQDQSRARQQANRVVGVAAMFLGGGAAISGLMIAGGMRLGRRGR